MKAVETSSSWRQDIAADRRRRTREKLISAAARVVAECGEQKASIDDFITAAGVARGTFYNHYSTREELLDDLWARIGHEPFREIQQASQSVADPAKRLAAEARQILERAARDKIWGWLVYAFSNARTVPADLLSYPRPDLVIGHRSGRFKFSNLDSASDLVVGALRASLRGILEQGRSVDYTSAMIILILKALGISEQEAIAIAAKPLPRPSRTPPEPATKVSAAKKPASVSSKTARGRFAPAVRKKNHSRST